jgi:cytosine deaminase
MSHRIDSAGTSSVAPAIMVGLAAAAAAAASSLYFLSSIKILVQANHTGDLRKTLARRAAFRRAAFRTSDVRLENVRIPIAVLLSSTILNAKNVATSADDEGLVHCSVVIQGGTIASIDPPAALSPTSSIFAWSALSVDCRGAILLPCFVDAHTHLIKTEVVPRLRNHSGTITEALTIESLDQPRWKACNDIRRRMEFAIQTALHHGTRAMRTHLDGSESQDPEVRDAVYEAFDTLRDEYQDKMIIQGVANLFLPLWLTPMAKQHADTAKMHGNVVLGAYVGRLTTGSDPDPDTVAAMDALFDHAIRLGHMDCDMHIDETNDPASCALASLCESLGKARKKGYRGKVLLGHCCALSLQSKATQKRICQQLAELKTFVVSNPSTNLGLQDRKGSKEPSCLEIPADVARTPQWRGLTLLQELREAGVTTAAASDNVRDHWYPYGDYDMLSVWAQAQAMGHLDTASSEGEWADVVTTAPAQAMGLTFGGMNAGEPADFVMFPSARRASELFARPQTDRIVLRQGKVQHTVLPSFAELDDLVDIKTERKV